jgi:hypothetical protein
VSIRGALARPAPRPSGPARPRTRPKAVPAARKRRRPRIRLGLAVIPLVAILFAGVVWVNAAKLSVTKRQGQIARQMTAVQEQLMLLTAQQAQEDQTVKQTAENLGMIRPGSGDWTYVTARPGP